MTDLDGTSAPGVSTSFARGDHKHGDAARHLHNNILALSSVSGVNTGDKSLTELGGVAANPTILAGTNTKITYDAKGLVTGGAAATATDVGLGDCNNTSDLNKPVSTATQTALDLKANITSPTLAGTPLAPTAAAGTSTTQIATTAYSVSAAPNASYRTIAMATGSHVAGKVAGTYMIGNGNPLAVSGTGTLYPIVLIPYYAADYPTVNGLTTKLRIRAVVAVNNVAPTGNFTIGLYPVTSGAGGAALKIFTVGVLVANSATTTVVTPAGSSCTTVVSSNFTPPVDGFYCMAVVTTATVAASSLVQVWAYLQMRNT